MLYTKQLKYDQAEQFFQRALKIREQVLGPKHPDVAQSRNDLAILYLGQSKYDQAAPLLESALEIREQILGSEHLLVAQTLSNLAELHEAWEEPFLADAFKQRAWKIHKILE